MPAPKHYSKSSLDHWARAVYGKKYEYLTDAEAQHCWDMLKDFLLEWQEEMNNRTKGAI